MRSSLKKTGKITLVEGSESVLTAYRKAAEAAKKEYFKLVGEKRGRELLDSLEAAVRTLR